MIDELAVPDVGSEGVVRGVAIEEEALGGGAVGDEESFAAVSHAVEGDHHGGDGGVDLFAADAGIDLREGSADGGAVAAGQGSEAVTMPMEIPRRVEDEEVGEPIDFSEERVEEGEVGGDAVNR